MEFGCFLKEVITRPKRKIYCLLVQPNYYSTYPPLGLMKISAFLKLQGHLVEMVSPPQIPKQKPDVIFVTSLFTYAWRKVKEAVLFYKKTYPKVPVVVGGIYATLLPDHVKDEIKPDHVWQGIIPEVENICPDYSFFPEWNTSIVFASRGCIRKCPFCVVWKMEPKYEAKKSIEHLIVPQHSRITFWDNNFLASPYVFELLDFLTKYRNAEGKRVEVDFNQGLDARLITLPIAEKLRNVKFRLVRLAYDRREDKKHLSRAIANLTTAGFSRKDILVYSLYNFKESPDEFLERLQDIMEWGVIAYPMRFQPVDALEKDRYVAPGWSSELLEMVAKARRVLGVNGAFPSYEGLKRKFLDASSLEEAMRLREFCRRKTVY